MQVSCDNINNKKAIRLWKNISKWADSSIVNKNIQAPYQAAMSMFESRFHIPMDYAVLLSDKQGGAFLTRGNINAFVKDALDRVSIPALKDYIDTKIDTRFGN